VPVLNPIAINNAKRAIQSLPQERRIDYKRLVDSLKTSINCSTAKLTLDDTVKIFYGILSVPPELLIALLSDECENIFIDE